MSKLRVEWLFSFVIAGFCVVLSFVDLYRVQGAPAGLHSRGLITAVDNSQVHMSLIIKTEAQFLTVQMLDGPCKGQTVEVENMLTGKMELDEFYEPDRVILVEYDIKEGKVAHAMARGYHRLHLQVMLIACFVGLLVAVAGVTGLKAALSFIFSTLVLWKLFFPLLLRGYAPIPTGLVIVSLIIGVITFSVGGLNRRGCATFIGSMLGVFLTCALAFWSTGAFHLHGAVRPFAEALLYTGLYQLNLTDIFVASIFIASSGAVMDLAMDIAASMDEIKHNHPQISIGEHVRSGLRVGRAVTGTMTPTLLLAYSSSHICMFMLFLVKGLPAINLFNAPFVAAEILNILVGSFGLIAVAPFTALVAGVLYRRQG